MWVKEQHGGVQKAAGGQGKTRAQLLLLLSKPEQALGLGMSATRPKTCYLSPQALSCLLPTERVTAAQS